MPKRSVTFSFKWVDKPTMPGLWLLSDPLEWLHSSTPELSVQEVTRQGRGFQYNTPGDPPVYRRNCASLRNAKWAGPILPPHREPK